MWLVVGLGNPGARYKNTRHNVGFMVVDELARILGLVFEDSYQRFEAKGSLGDEDIKVIRPLTYMNRSGLSVIKAVGHSFPPEKLIVVHDDLDMEPGRLKIRTGGSSGGHRGIESIISETGCKDFIRVKIGIGRDEDIPPEKFVLMKFGKHEKTIIENTISMATDSVISIIRDGAAKAMNVYNRKNPATS